MVSCPTCKKILNGLWYAYYFFFQIESCGFSWPRNSIGYLIIFFSDVTLFYFIPLLLSLILYSLIGKMLFSQSKSMFAGNGTRSSALSAAAAAKSSQQKFQVSPVYQNYKKFMIEVRLGLNRHDNVFLNLNHQKRTLKSERKIECCRYIDRNCQKNAISCCNGTL